MVNSEKEDKALALRELWMQEGGLRTKEGKVEWKAPIRTYTVREGPREG